MLPCGTPKVTGRASDNSFSEEVRCFRLLKYDVNHSKALGETTDDDLDINLRFDSDPQMSETEEDQTECT